MPWGDPGVTEQLLIQETALNMPSLTGGLATRTLQRAGLLKSLRFWYQAKLDVSAYTSAPGKSVYGVLGAGLSRIRVAANGQIPLVDLSGLGATIYNEVQNRDGSPLTAPAHVATVNLTQGAALTAYDAIGATGSFLAKYPFEFQFALPISVQGQMQELGLWLLQNQAIDVGIECSFNALYATTASTRSALWSGGTSTSAADLANTKLSIERALYSMPQDEKSYPRLEWVHQVVEFDMPFTGNFCRFSIPRAGLLLRAVVHNLDGNGDPVEYTDVNKLDWVYGANETPISRPGWSLAQEYLQDYGRMGPKGSLVLDFYKWGEQGLKLVKSTMDLANLRIEETFASTSTGTVKVILDRLIPVGKA